jgi:hypothetical protein
MARWFRFYSDAMRHPKVASLSDKEFRLWCDLLCVASERDGSIPPLSDLRHILKRRLDHLSTGVERLISARLIVRLGDAYAPYGWDEKQYKSDTSTDRVKRYREKRNVSVTPPDTDTDTDADTVTKVTGELPSPDKVFWDSAKAYLGKSKGGLIGKWVRDYGRDATAKAITAAQIERAVDPVPYIERVLRKRESGDGRDCEMTMPC